MQIISYFFCIFHLQSSLRIYQYYTYVSIAPTPGKRPHSSVQDVNICSIGPECSLRSPAVGSRCSEAAAVQARGSDSLAAASSGK